MLARHLCAASDVCHHQVLPDRLADELFSWMDTVATDCKVCHWTKEGCAVLEINRKVRWFIYTVALNTRRDLFGGCFDTITRSTDWCRLNPRTKGRDFSENIGANHQTARSHDPSLRLLLLQMWSSVFYDALVALCLHTLSLEL